MHYKTFEHHALRFAHAAIAEHTQEIAVFTDATASRATYGTKLSLSESLAHPQQAFRGGGRLLARNAPWVSG